MAYISASSRAIAAITRQGAGLGRMPYGRGWSPGARRPCDLVFGHPVRPGKECRDWRRRAVQISSIAVVTIDPTSAVQRRRGDPGDDRFASDHNHAPTVRSRSDKVHAFSATWTPRNIGRYHRRSSYRLTTPSATASLPRRYLPHGRILARRRTDTPPRPTCENGACQLALSPNDSLGEKIKPSRGGRRARGRGSTRRRTPGRRPSADPTRSASPSIPGCRGASAPGRSRWPRPRCWGRWR